MQILLIHPLFCAQYPDSSIHWKAHLDLLASVGGNYLRGSMSSRDRQSDETDYFHDDNLYPFHRDANTGLYDMERFNDEYWQRFRNFLDMTVERDIIVQIEIWDRHDFGADRGPYPAKGWSEQPYNPVNNINYTSEESGFPEVRTTSTHSFFRTTPDLENNTLVLQYQEAYVEKLLSISLEYGHVLYCISNETHESEHWSGYWANLIRVRAEEAGREVEITEMWGPVDLMDPKHRNTFDRPDLYSFAEISQHNHQEEGQIHWDNMQQARQLLADPPRPMNNVKIYGGERFGGGLEGGIEKFWRNIIGGSASARFHRPGAVEGYYGAGLGLPAQTNIRSMRMFTEEFNIFVAEPDNNLLMDRGENEAYCAATPSEQYAVYFTDGGAVQLDLRETEGEFRLRWLNILESVWAGESVVNGGEYIDLTAPGEGQWVAVVLAYYLASKG